MFVNEGIFVFVFFFMLVDCMEFQQQHFIGHGKGRFLAVISLEKSGSGYILPDERTDKYNGNVLKFTTLVYSGQRIN